MVLIAEVIVDELSHNQFDSPARFEVSTELLKNPLNFREKYY